MSGYLVPAGYGEAELIEKRSRFIARVWPVENEEEAVARIREMREKHWDATHNVYAYIIHGGPTRYSDDGEPQGTAGMPVLEVLRGAGVENVCCVVTRYFGGTLLGTGGLVRAYGKAARDALAETGVALKQLWKLLDLILPYSHFERIRQEVERFSGIVADTEYSADICLHVLLPASQAPAFIARVTDLTRGTVTPVEAGEEFRAVAVDN